MEPLCKGHLRTNGGVLYLEVILLGQRQVSLVWRCPLFRVLFVRVSTVVQW